MKRFWTLLLLLISVGFASAQVVSTNGGAISGVITDPSGASVPGADVTVSSTDIGYTKTLKTDSGGLYSVGPLNPGNYKVRVSAPGFQGLEVSTVIRVGTVTPGTFKLALGSSNETIEVSAGAVQVNTDQAGVSDVLTAQQLQSLPVNGRNFLDIAQIEPGVILQAGSSFDPTKAGYSAISVGGVSGRTTRILLDGQDITDETVGTTIFNVSQGAIGEFQLNRATQDASGEVTSTGMVLVSTQSGTNHFHGQAFYNFQDYRALFAAASLNSTTPNPPFQRNQYGGSFGGPLFRDKLFFFANSERIQQATATPANLGNIFTGPGSINEKYPNINTPYKLTYSTGRLDYNGPLGGHYFFRGAYNVDAASRNPTFYELYTNRDNTYGLAGGADFQRGRFTHSFRGSYEKFHNFIADSTAGNTAIYYPIPNLTLTYANQVAYGPNGNVPQATYQSDKQFRYDGGWTVKQHILRFGYSLNRILGGGFFAARSLSPTVTIASTSALTGTVTAGNPNGFSCSNGAAGGPTCLGDPNNGYATAANGLTLGNGLGGENEFPGFGLPGGGQFDWREGAYVQDTWKVTPSFTVSGGVRWSVDTGRANQDLAPVLCSDIGTSFVSVPTGCASGNTPLFSLYNPSYTGKVHQSYGNFAPQFGINYAPGDHKTVFRAAAGIFFESDVFNVGSNARNNLLKKAYGFGSSTSACTNYQVNMADGTIVTSVNGTSLKALCTESVQSAASSFIALQQQYQSIQKANLGSNVGFVGNTLNISGQYAPFYRTPYGEQFNFGIQRQIHRGATLSVDYIHDAVIHIGQTLDQNHVGAARTFNQTNAVQAIRATLAVTCAGAANVQAAITPGGCSGGTGGSAGAKYATIVDFAKNGLDRGQTFNSGGPASFSKKTVNGVVNAQSAFPGLNGQLGTGSFIAPIGRSGYDALQAVYKEQATHPMPGIASSNFQISYSLSRIVASTTSSDEFFAPAVIDNDNPTVFMGRSALDHKHEVSFGGSATLGGGWLKYGPRLSLLAHFFSAPPSTLLLDNAAISQGNIFQTDVTGDGTTSDVVPTTQVGDYMHRINPRNLSGFINNYNATQAGKLTPAGLAVVNGTAGTGSTQITAAQLAQMGAAIQPVAQIASGIAVFNPTYRQMDAQFSYPIPVSRIIPGLREGVTLEPTIAFYNVGNFSNFAASTATLQNTTTATCSSVTAAQAAQGFAPSTAGATNTCPSGSGFITGINNLGVAASKRTVRGIGTFDQGAQRTTEFQLHLNF